MSSYSPVSTRSTRRVRTRKRVRLLTPFQKMLQQSIDWGMLAAIFAVPLFLGGRLALGQVVLVAAAGWMAVSWSWFQSTQQSPRYTPTRVEPLLLLAVLLIWVQCFPWPADFLHQLIPNLKPLLPLWHPQSGEGLSLGEWNTVSLTPALTRQVLVIFLAYTLIFLVTAQRIESTSDIETILKKIACASLLMAGFGLTQYFGGNGKFFWTYEHPILSTEGSVKGSFTNGNHFSHFVALGVGPLIWWILRVTEPEAPRKRKPGTLGNSEQKPLLAVLLSAGLGVVALAILMALSRGGAVVMAVSLLIVLSICYRRDYVSGKVLSGLIGSAVLAGIGLSLYGLDQVSANLDDWSTGRWLIWAANLEVFREFPIFGTGLGSHAEAYQNHLDLPLFEKKFSHAESGYVQILSETGLVGISLLALVMLFPIYWCLRGLRFAQSRRSVTIFAAVLGSVIANYIHAVVDFIWWVPGCMVLLLILAACACRQYQITRSHHQREVPEATGTVPRSMAWTALCMLLFASFWMGKETWPVYRSEQDFHDFQRLPELVLESKSAQEMREAALYRLSEQLKLLISAVNNNPNDAHLHLRLSRAYQAMFQLQQADSDNPMSLAQIADAVHASKFSSVKEMQGWLNRAIGENLKYLQASHFHTRQALRLCPLLGDGYAQLALTLFLEGGDELASEHCLAQAYIVRPYDADVLYAVGAQYWKQGKYEEAAVFWKRSFQREVRLQSRIIKLITGTLPAELIVKVFEPDLEALRRLRDRHRTHGEQDQLNYILAQYAMASQKLAENTVNETSSRAWMQAHLSFDELGYAGRAEFCLLQALNQQPNEYNLRSRYAKWLSNQKRYEEALPHFEWCLQIKPNDEKLLAKYQIARRNRHSSLPAQITPRTTPVKTARAPGELH